MEEFEQLSSNFKYIQGKIDEIKSLESIDIKQISDLQRYVEMQKNILESMMSLRNVVLG